MNPEEGNFFGVLFLSMAIGVESFDPAPEFCSNC
jgi:hypothetical protein